MNAQQARATAVITWVAGAVALFVTLALPIGCFTTGLRGVEALISAKAAVRAEKVSQIIAASHDFWKIDLHHLSASLQNNPTHDEGERSVVRDMQNDVIVAFGPAPARLTLTTTRALYDSGVVAGYLDVHYPLHALVRETAWMAVLASLLGAGIFVVFRQHPLRALDRALRTITEEQQRAARLKMEKEDAEAITRAKSQFLAKMSHEIRTPMNGVLGMTELLQRTELSAQQARFVGTVQRAGESLLAIIDDILDFSKIEAGKLALEHVDFDLRQTIGDVVALFAEGARHKGLSFACRMAADLPPHVRGDPVRLRQILTNLINNAIKFTERGEIVVEVSRTGAECLRLSVADTGIGIAPETAATLFQPFHQADNSTSRKFGGTGLGLAIVKQLAEMMGGTVELESTPGQGSTFSVTVRLAPAAADAAGPPPRDLPTAVPVTAELLLAEDNAMNRELALEMLADTGYRVSLVGNGREALAALAGASFAAVLMDCHMPELDGFEATRLLRRQEAETGRRRTPVIALTANAMSEDRERCREAGMDDYLAKPYRRDALLAALARWTQPGEAGAVAEAPVTPDATGATPIDAGALQALRALQRPDRPSVLTRMIDLFDRDAPRLLGEMRDAARTGDTTALRDAAHLLKSNCATIGATALAAICREIEQNAKQRARGADASGAIAIMPLAAAEYELERVLAALARERRAA
ncbi:MAG: response regulator [Rhodocyclales bacterium]|nr:response regulator [Rhodocyclales bacterium]